QRPDILDLTRNGVWPGVPALAASAPVVDDHGERVAEQGGEPGASLIHRAILGRPGHKDQRRAGSMRFIGDGSAIGGGYRGHFSGSLIACSKIGLDLLVLLIALAFGSEI